MKELDFGEYYGTFKKVNKDKKFEVFYNKKLNNLLVFNPIDVEDDTFDIINATIEDAYFQLTNELNSNKGLVVYWYKVEGTTSDYTIYYDLGDPKELKDLSFPELLNKMTLYGKLYNSSKYNKAVENELVPLKIK